MDSCITLYHFIAVYVAFFSALTLPRGGPNGRGTTTNGRNSKGKKDTTASNDYNR